MKNFKFEIYGVKGQVKYAMCLDETMIGTITVGKVVSRFSYNIGTDILPVVNGCGKREERMFLHALIKDEYEKELESLRFDIGFFRSISRYI